MHGRTTLNRASPPRIQRLGDSEDARLYSGIVAGRVEPRHATSHSNLWGTVNHTYQADSLWLKRLQGNSDARLDGVIPASDLATLRTVWAQVQGDFVSWAGGLDDHDWERVIDYRFMSGKEGRSPIYESILHVVNHGTYHRGQIVTMLRQLGAEPIATDFIHYVRIMMAS